MGETNANAPLTIAELTEIAKRFPKIEPVELAMSDTTRPLFIERFRIEPSRVLGSFCGIPIVADPTIPDGMIELRQSRSFVMRGAFPTPTPEDGA